MFFGIARVLLHFGWQQLTLTIFLDFFPDNLKDSIYYNMNGNLGWNTEKDWTAFGPPPAIEFGCGIIRRHMMEVSIDHRA